MSNNQNGWITLHRKIKDHWLWESKPFSYGQAWIDILLECNHAESKQLIKGQLITTKRGQSSNAKITWARRFGWGISATRHFLEMLEKDEMISTHNAHVTTVLTVLNYDSYQTKSIPKGFQKDSKKISEGFQKDTNNNDNNLNNENKKQEKRKRFTPPPLNDIEIYFLEKDSDQNEAQRFYDFYTSNGWKVGRNPMKDWKASARGWISRNITKEDQPMQYDPEAMV